MRKLIFYRDKCIGCGVCSEQQPWLWRLSKKDGKAVMLNAQQKKQVFITSLPAVSIEPVKQVVEACPARIIKLEN